MESGAGRIGFGFSKKPSKRSDNAVNVQEKGPRQVNRANPPTNLWHPHHNYSELQCISPYIFNLHPMYEFVNGMI